MSSVARQELTRARRVVVKVGSSAVASGADMFSDLADGVLAAKKSGRAIVIVSSGAIALGTEKLGYRARPREMAQLQAAAAAGQTSLMRAYEEAFAPRGLPVAQVLLTHADLSDRTRAINAAAALDALLDAGAVPVLNENDSVAVEEIKFGDNDALSSMVVPLVRADLLLLLSDVDGLLDARGARVSTVHDVAKDAMPHVRAQKSAVGTGGMSSKLEAARRATLAGAHVVIANARARGIIGSVISGEDVGTWCVASTRKIPAKKHWIAFTLRPRGDLVLDEGATIAVRSKGKSVLAVGVRGVRGDFGRGDSVRILGADGVELGRGLARASATEAVVLAGQKVDDEPAVLVHRDDLVVW